MKTQPSYLSILGGLKMQEFIDDTDARIESTLKKLLKPDLSKAEQQKELSKLNDLYQLRDIYIKIQAHNKEPEMIM